MAADPRVGRPPDAALDPFALPDETRSRFALMVLAALVLAFTSGFALRILVLPWGTSPLAGMAAPTADVNDPRFFAAHRDYALGLAAGLVNMMGAGVVLAVAVAWAARAIFRRYPERLRRQKAAQPLAADGPGGRLAALLHDLCAARGVPAPPVEVYGPLTSQHAQVYGSTEQPRLLVGRGMLLQAARRPAEVAAVLHHEVAHIANQDVSRSYLTWSLFAAAGALALAPVLLGIAGNLAASAAQRLADGQWARFWGTNVPTAGFSLAQLAGAGALLVVALASFLRVRETFADWRAASWGQRATLLDILRRNAAVGEERPWGFRPRLHPSAAERIAALEQPLRLFGLSGEVAFLAGALAGLALPPLAMFTLQAGLALSGLASGTAATLGAQGQALELALWLLWAGALVMLVGVAAPFLAVAYLLSGALGLEVQRQAVADAHRDRRGRQGYTPLWRPAAALVLGVQVGAALVPLLPASPISVFATRAVTGADPLAVAPWSAAGVAAAWLGLACARYWSLRFLGRHLGPRPPRWKRRLVTAYFAALAAPVLLALLVGQWAAGLPGAGIGLDDPATGLDGALLLTGFLAATGAWTALLSAGMLALWWAALVVGAVGGDCHSCRHPLPPGASVASVCPRCGEPAGRWLLAAPAPATR